MTVSGATGLAGPLAAAEMSLAAVAAQLLAAEDRDVLVRAWRLAMRARNMTVLLRGRPTDELPRDIAGLSAVAQLLGYGPERASEFLDDYRRTTRRARQVVERVFYER